MTIDKITTDWKAVVLSRREERAIPRIEEAMQDYGIEIYSPRYAATIFKKHLNQYIVKEHRMLPRIILVRFHTDKQYPWVELLDLLYIAYILKGPRITDEEIENLKKKEAEYNQNKERLIISFAVGDNVEIIGGAMAGLVGEVESININKKTATIKTQLFGRTTSVEISVDSVELV